MSRCRGLIVSGHPALRRALAAVVAGLTSGTIVDQASSVDSAGEVLGRGPVDFVLVDASSLKADAVTGLIRKVKAEAPQAQCAVMADETRSWVSAADVDAVLVLGTPAAVLRATIGGMLSRQTGWSF